MIAPATFAVWRPDGWRKDTHLECVVWYRSADGKARWNNFTTDFAIFDTAEEQFKHAMKCQTAFVKANWLRVEVCVPNRDQYGHLRPDKIQDVGLLLAVREEGEAK